MGALSRPEEVLALVKLRVAAGQIKRQIPPEEHWAFGYSMLQKVSRSFALVIQQLGPELRNAVSTNSHSLRLPPSIFASHTNSLAPPLGCVWFRVRISHLWSPMRGPPVILFAFVPTSLVRAFRVVSNVCCCDCAGVHLLPRAPCPRHRWLVWSHTSRYYSTSMIFFLECFCGEGG